MYNSKQLEHLRLLLQVRPTHRTVRENKSCSSPSLYLNYRWTSDNDNRINITLENRRQSHKQSCLERTFGNLCTSIGIVHILLWLLIMTSKLNMLMIMKIYAWWVLVFKPFWWPAVCICTGTGYNASVSYQSELSKGAKEWTQETTDHRQATHFNWRLFLSCTCL